MEKLSSNQTKDYIADIIRKEILSGSLADGEEVTQEEIASMLEVSRMPVREAFQILELEGLLMRLKNRHVQVIGPTNKKVSEIMAIIADFEAGLCKIWISESIDVSILYGQYKNLNVENENAIEFHKQFSIHINNEYLHQVHVNLLKVYPKYIYENLALVPTKILDTFQNLIEAIACKDLLLIQNILDLHFNYLADIMAESIERGE